MITALRCLAIQYVSIHVTGGLRVGSLEMFGSFKSSKWLTLYLTSDVVEAVLRQIVRKRDRSFEKGQG